MQLGQLVEHLHSALDHVIQKSQLADEVGQLWITEWRFAKSAKLQHDWHGIRRAQQRDSFKNSFFCSKIFLELVYKTEKKQYGGTKEKLFGWTDFLSVTFYAGNGGRSLNTVSSRRKNCRWLHFVAPSLTSSVASIHAESGTKGATPLF